MLSEQEIIKKAFKEMLQNEQTFASKLEQLQKEITEPKIQKMFQGMEMASRLRQSILIKKMSGY